MVRTRMSAFAGALTLAAAAVGTSASADAAPTRAATTATVMAATATSTASTTTATDYVVLAKKGADVTALAAKLRAAGATVTSVNTAIGMVTVSSGSSRFLGQARALTEVQRAARDGVVGRAPKADKDSIEKPWTSNPGNSHGRSAHSTKGTKRAADPLDDQLWGMDLIDAPKAHRIEMGDKRVRVGIIDTGVDGTHPDIAPNFDRRLSRNFTTDLVDIDGPCEYASCVDPPNVDDNGHGTHVAGTIAGAMNGIGVSGVAPDVGIVNLRAGQDSGYFFLGPTVNALTYAGDHGVDVVNMSFYVDPWAYNCVNGAPEDSDEQGQEQNAIIEAMNRALDYAHGKNVTMVGALGNGNDDVANPRPDTTSPDYPAGTEHPRTIDNATCFDLPVEGPHVIGVSSIGPTQRKAYYSNWTTDLRSKEIEVSAPGGDFRDFFGTDKYRTPGNLILSAAPLNVLQAEGAVDVEGNITEGNEGFVVKDCRSIRGRGEQCGYYQMLQGTSMASPHAAGVAALIVSHYGKVRGKAGFTLAADKTRRILMDSARDKACPNPPLFTYPDRPASYNALCVGDADFNGFYGDGIVNAYNAVR